MASAAFECPLCCTQRFPSCETLRDHLSTYLWEHLSCPVCHDKLYGIQELWFHLEQHIPVKECFAVVHHRGNEDPSHFPSKIEDIVISEDQDNLAPGRDGEDSHENLCMKTDGEEVMKLREKAGSTDRSSFPVTADSLREWTSDYEVLAVMPCTNNTIDSDTSLASLLPINDRSNTDSELVTEGITDNLVCGICNVSIPSIDAMHEHAISDHGISHIMMPYANNGSTLRALQNSVPAEDILQKYSANIVCSAQEDNSSHCEKHKKMTPKKQTSKLHQNVKTQNHECEICKKSFSTAKVLQEHKERLHLKIRSCLCNQCGMTFYDHHGLKAHMKFHGKKPFTCQFCNKGFVWAADLRRHEGKHTGKMTHICETCGKGYLNGYQLNVHLRTHSGDRPFVCQVCGAAFMSKSNLRSHKVTHETGCGDNAFACNYCSKVFPSKVKLYHHHRMHIKPFKCETCGHGFTCTRDLDQHVRTHSRDYSCNVCGLQFTQAAKLLKHESAHERQRSSLS